MHVAVGEATARVGLVVPHVLHQVMVLLEVLPHRGLGGRLVLEHMAKLLEQVRNHTGLRSEVVLFQHCHICHDIRHVWSAVCC